MSRRSLGFERDRFTDRPGPALAAGVAVGALGALAAGVAGEAAPVVALTLWLGLGTVTYYPLRYGSPPTAAAFVPASTTPLRYGVAVVALGTAVLGVVLTVLAETTEWTSRTGD